MLVSFSISNGFIFCMNVPVQINKIFITCPFEASGF